MNLSSEHREKLMSVLKGAAIAFLGAGLVSMAEWLSSSDFGSWTPWLQAIASVALNAARVVRSL